MRYLWAEDFDSDRQDKAIMQKRWDDYFQLEGAYINFQTLEEILGFLDDPSNWSLFDAVLIDIRFSISNGSTEDEIYRKYFRTFLKKDKYEKYAKWINDDPCSASAGILLFLALVHRYNYNQSRIAFISANVDGSGNSLSCLKNMREYLYKASYQSLTDDEIAYFSELSAILDETYQETMERVKKTGRYRYDKIDMEMDFPLTDDIDWEGLKVSQEKRRYLFEKLDRIEELLLRPLSEENIDGLKYNSVKAEFDKVGLLVPQAFEKPNVSELMDRSWRFQFWKEHQLALEYYQLRSMIVPVCLEIEKNMKEKGEQIFRPYSKIFPEVDNAENKLSQMLVNIVELFPPNVWTQNNTSLYTRILKECVNLCDEKIDTNSCKVILKIARNWLAHQGIEKIEAFDVAFIFHVMIHTFFDMAQERNYKVLDTVLIKGICEHSGSKLDKKTIIDKCEVVIKRKHEEAFNKFIDLLTGVSSVKREDYRQNGYKDRKNCYRYDSKASLFQTISAIGNNLSPIKESVSMQELYLLFLANSQNDSYGWETCLEQELLKRLNQTLSCLANLNENSLPL